jgi:cytoskeletal protein CcmA (bactofilin family)
MFRRKEEGLFDSNIDPNQAQDDLIDAAPAAAQPAASYQQAPAATASYNAAPAANNTSAQAPRPASANAVPTASSFRPAPAQNSAAPAANSAPANASRPAMPTQASAAPAANSAPAGNAKATGKRVLTVGNDILLKGEIATCDRLVIEGKVDATLNDVHTVEIAEHGSFKGSAQIEDAEISGLFEGDLTVRGRLVIYATGKVRGTISYGEIEIERGGELTGEIKIAGSAPAQARGSRAKEDKVAA